MKRFFISCFMPVFLVIGLLFTGCSKQQASKFFIEQTVKTENSKCPQDLGDGFVLTKAKIEGNCVVYYYILDNNDQVNNICAVNPEVQAKIILNQLASTKKQNPQLVMFINMVAASGMELKYVYTGNNCTTMCECVIPNHMLAEFDNMSASQASVDNVELFVNQFNQSCPLFLSEGMQIDRCSVDDGAIVYDVQVDEDVLELDYESMKTNEHASTTCDALFEKVDNDSDARSLMEMCLNNNLGIIYRYIGSNSEEVVDVVVSCAMIKEKMNK